MSTISQQGDCFDFRGLRIQGLKLTALILGAYEELRKSRFLGLPHRTTLNRYTSFTSSGAGFNLDIIKRLYGDLKVSILQRYEKQAILLLDEIKTKSGLEYSKSTGCIAGST